MSRTSRSARIRTTSHAATAGGLLALTLSIAPAATADGDPDPGASRNDIGPVQPAPSVDVRRLLNDIDDPQIAPKPAHDGGEPAGTSPDTDQYVGLVLGGVVGLAVGAGAIAAVVVRRGHAHAARLT